MKGVYLNVYYEDADRFGDTVIWVYRAHTDTREVFCDTYRDPHHRARGLRRRRRQRREWRRGE